MISNAIVTVTTTAAALTMPAAAKTVTIRNLDASTTVYYGSGTTVTADQASTGGFPILAGEVHEIGGHDNIYLLVASGTAKVAVVYEEN